MANVIVTSTQSNINVSSTPSNITVTDLDSNNQINVTQTNTTITVGSTVSNITVSKATYTKIGRQVFVSSTCRYTGSSSTSQIIGYSLPFTSSSTTVLGVSGTFTHDPGSGNSGYIMGSVGSNGGNTNYYFVIPGGRYLSNWTQDYYLNFAFWFTT